MLKIPGRPPSVLEYDVDVSIGGERGRYWLSYQNSRKNCSRASKSDHCIDVPEDIAVAAADQLCMNVEDVNAITTQITGPKCLPKKFLRLKFRVIMDEAELVDAERSLRKP